MFRSCRIWTVAAALLGIPIAVRAATIPETIEVCEDGAEWPPYSYYERANGQPTQKVVGFAVDYLKDILDRQGIKFNISLIPWKRCQHAIMTGDYTMALNASYSEERQRDFYMSRQFYTLSAAYFYDGARNPPQINAPTDLTRYRVCGIVGYNYSQFGLKDQDVDTSTTGFEEVFEKIKMDRCDILPERLEVIAGYAVIGAFDFRSMGIRYISASGIAPSTFHMIVSRDLPYGADLLDILNDGIDRMEKTHAAGTLAKKYGLPTP